MNKVLRNTYALLSMTLLFSAAMAGLSIALNWPYPGVFVTLAGYFGLLFLTTKLRNSAWGILSVFALTGFMGVTLGPIINMYLYAYANGAELVMMALGGTGIIFLAMSGLALTSKRDFSFMGKFLMIGILVAFVAALGNLFFPDGGTYSVSDAADRTRRRNELHHGDSHAFCQPVQPFHQPAAPAWFWFRQRLRFNPTMCMEDPPKCGSFFTR
jgi:hypothetical protein